MVRRGIVYFGRRQLEVGNALDRNRRLSMVALSGDVELGVAFAWLSANVMCHSVKAVTLTALGCPRGQGRPASARRCRREGLSYHMRTISRRRAWEVLQPS